MTDKKKAEVNLEICSGFFRIPTDDIIYNIKVLSSGEQSTTKVIEKIIEVEKIVEVEKKAPASPPAAASAAATGPAAAVDNYFQQTARKFQQEIAAVAQEAGSTPTSGGSVDMSAIQDLAAMAGDLKGVLLAMKNEALVSEPGSVGGGAATPLTSTIEQLTAKISQAKELCSTLAEAPAQPASTGGATKTITRYLFNLDAVFQTIYELCTNETVKGHIQSARAKADEIFDKEAFYNAISPKAGGYPEDDGFLTVPMTDIYTALGNACNDKATVNLLSKMDKQQAAIFLDQFLPLEVPPKEEVIVAEEGGAVTAESTPSPAVGGGEALVALLSECQASLDTLINQGAEQAGVGQTAVSEDLINKIDDAITITASIHSEARRLAEDKGGGPTPLWLKIKALAALSETMLLRKEADSSLTFEDGLAAGQAAGQRCLEGITLAVQSPPPPKKETTAKKAPAQDDFGEASQDDIDRLLEELG